MAHLRPVLLLAAVLLFLTTLGTSTPLVQGNLHAPCDYIDTVNLTGYQRFPNGSYLYEGSIIPADLVGIYNYKTDASLKEIPVQPHFRGCICKVKPCVQFCCSLDKKYNAPSCEPFNGFIDYEMNITTKEGEVVADVRQKFTIQFGQPCFDMYLLIPQIYEFDAFSLFENGTLLRLADKKYLTKDKYCLATFTNYDNVTDLVVPTNCFQTQTDETKSVLYACTMLFSVPFMILTIIVYMATPERRTLHGKSLCCYLLGLSFGYTILSLFNLVSHEYISQFQCAFWGFVAYFSFMASFFWLSVISYQLFSNILAPRGRFNEKKRFIMYSLYAWGLGLIFLGLTFSAQYTSVISDHWKPAIGSAEYCWLNVKTGWSAVIYFYAPIIIIIGFNITMFILTALKINGVQKEMNRMMARNESQKNLRNEKDRFEIFLRLFIVTGITWSMEIISYLIGPDSSWNNLFWITDICNGIQGILIFTLFVLRDKVKRYLNSRSKKNPEPSKPSQSTSSNEMSERI